MQLEVLRHRLARFGALRDLHARLLQRAQALRGGGLRRGRPRLQLRHRRRRRVSRRRRQREILSRLRARLLRLVELCEEILAVALRRPEVALQRFELARELRLRVLEAVELDAQLREARVASLPLLLLRHA